MSTTTPAPTPRTDAERHKTHACYDAVTADFARTLERELTSMQAALAAKNAEVEALKNTGLPQTCAVKIPTSNGLGYFIGTDEFGKSLVEALIIRAEKAEAALAGELVSTMELRREATQLRAEVEHIKAWANAKSDEAQELRAELTAAKQACLDGHRRVNEMHRAALAAKDAELARMKQVAAERLEWHTESRRERDQLRAEVEGKDAENAELIKERDEAEDAADKIASEVLGEAIDWPAHDAAWQRAAEAAKEMRFELHMRRNSPAMDEVIKLRAEVGQYKQDFRDQEKRIQAAHRELAEVTGDRNIKRQLLEKLRADLAAAKADTERLIVAAERVLTPSDKSEVLLARERWELRAAIDAARKAQP